MSSKVSKPGAFDTSPARAANRRSNSSTRSAGTVMALMRTMLMFLLAPSQAPARCFWSRSQAPALQRQSAKPLPLRAAVGKAAAVARLSIVSAAGLDSPGGGREGRREKNADGRVWSDRRVRGLLVRREGKYPDAPPLWGKREDRGDPGRSREPQFGESAGRPCPGPSTRLFLFPFSALALLAQEPLDLRRELVAARNVARAFVGLDVAHHLGDVGPLRQAFLDPLEVLVYLAVEHREVGLHARELAYPRQQRADSRRRRRRRHVVRHLRPQAHTGDPGVTEGDLERSLCAGRSRVVGAPRADFLRE